MRTKVTAVAPPTYISQRRHVSAENMRYMITTLKKTLLTLFLIVSMAGIAHARTDRFGEPIHPPKIPPLGMCEITWITSIQARFGPNDQTIHDGRTTIFASGISTSNEGSPNSEKDEKLYDKVILCLTKISKNCPKYYSKNGKGDHALSQFYTYMILDLRNGESWTDTPSEHYCNGA